MITSTSKDGYKRRLIFNETVLLVDKEDVVSFLVKDGTNFETTFNFTFSDSGEKLKTTGNVADNGKVVNMTLFQWDNSLGSEVTNPIELKAMNGKRIWVKFKTYADKGNSFRTFHLTIWGEI